MKIAKFLLILAILLLLPFALKTNAGEFGQGIFLFDDIKAHSVGGILTVITNEQSSAANQAQVKTEKTSKHVASGGPGIGTSDFFPLFGGESESKQSHDGQVSTTTGTRPEIFHTSA